MDNCEGGFMINFIVCDDNEVILKKVESVILKRMMKNDFAYKTYMFTDYGDEFDKVVNQKLSNKIYILDIEVPGNSGIDVARSIRNKDIDSIIIFLTSHEELGYMVLKSELMFLTFISKYDQYEENLEKAIGKGIELVGKKQYIKLEDRGVAYTLNEILYITKDSVERKTIIKTDYSEFKLNKTLLEIMEHLDENFKQTHRACIMNTRRIRSFDVKKKLVTFDDGSKVNLISDSYKKGLRIHG